MSSFASLLAVALVIGAGGVLALFGLHRLGLLFLYLRGRRRAAGAGAARMSQGTGAALPFVTVALPLYNERLVAERVIRAAAALAYPPDRLEIQVLDDSTDETSEIVARTISNLLRPDGPRIVHIQRGTREGFKAGALAAGLRRTTSELVAVFDSDFVPSSDFLLRTVGAFADPAVGMVQARWGFLNESDSILTRAEALSLRAHFHIEQGARYLAGRFFHFNGTAGVWRRAAIDSAGGWQGDTLTEDLDLSYRVQMRGWRFVYLDDVVVPSELPPTVQAFRTQQFRWMKGTAEVARKILPSLLAAPLPWPVKVEAVLHLLAPLSYAGALLSFLAVLPLLALGAATPIESPILGFYRWTLAAVLGVLAAYHIVAERGTGSWRGWFDFAARFACLLVVGAGNALTGTRAFFEGLWGRRSAFERTPKFAGRRRAYRIRLDPWIGVEAALAFCGVAFVSAAWRSAGARDALAPLFWWVGVFLAGWGHATFRQVAEAIEAR